MQALRSLIAPAVVALSLFAAACAGSTGAATVPPAGASVAAVSATAPASPTTAPAAAPTGKPTSVATPVAVPSAPTAAASTASVSATPASAASAIRYEIAASGTEASFRVREQLARLNAPSDAVGKTSAVKGSIVLTPDGKIVADQSKLTVDLSSLQSDSGMRDNFIKRSTLETARFPSAVFVPTEVRGLPSPLPTSGQQSFQLLGNLTIRDVTRPVTWDVTSQVEGDDLTGRATTTLTFQDFGLAKPSVAAVLSVNDEIRLEVAFHMTRSA